MARATSDIAAIRMALGPGFMHLIDTIVIGSFALIMMMSISVKLTLAAFSIFPFISIVVYWIGKKSHLYHNRIQESFSDLKVGTIKRLTPVRPDGSEDKSRRTVFVGHTNIITSNGPLPIQSAIQAKELQQAIKKFPEAMQEATDRLLEEVKKYQQEQERQQSGIQRPDSRIILPGR